MEVSWRQAGAGRTGAAGGRRHRRDYANGRMRGEVTCKIIALRARAAAARTNAAALAYMDDRA